MLKDKRDDYKGVPWQQGRVLSTKLTRSMSPEWWREAKEREARSLFAHFSLLDEGRGRVLLWQFNTAEECAAAVQQHNLDLAKISTAHTGTTGE